MPRLLSPLFHHRAEADQRKDLPSILSDPLAAGIFQLCDREFFESRKCVQRQGHARMVRALKEDERLFFASSLCDLLILLVKGAVAYFRNDTGAPRQTQDIQDQRDLSVPHDRRTGICVDAFELSAEWLDDDFLGVVDFIDDQAKL